MNTQKRKFELFARLQNQGFTYEEAAALRRIEMTLRRWGERECGDGSNWAIERDETTGKPFNVYHGEGKPHRHAIADREAGALRRLKAIVNDRNARQVNPDTIGVPGFGPIYAYHQTDCRGCNLYLVTREQLTNHDGTLAAIDANYTRGLAVCC
jgi:hypothetical protein